MSRTRSNDYSFTFVNFFSNKKEKRKYFSYYKYFVSILESGNVFYFNNIFPYVNEFFIIFTENKCYSFYPKQIRLSDERANISNAEKSKVDPRIFAVYTLYIQKLSYFNWESSIFSSRFAPKVTEMLRYWNKNILSFSLLNSFILYFISWI